MELAELVAARKPGASRQLVLVTAESFEALPERTARVSMLTAQHSQVLPDEALREWTRQEALLLRENACPRNREQVR